MKESQKPVLPGSSDCPSCDNAYKRLKSEYDRRHRKWIKDREDGKPYDDAAEAARLSLCGFWEAMELLV